MRPKVDALLHDNIHGYLDYIEAMQQPDLLRAIAGIIVDDIYRSANLLYYYSDDVADYLCCKENNMKENFLNG